MPDSKPRAITCFATAVLLAAIGYAGFHAWRTTSGRQAHHTTSANAQDRAIPITKDTGSSPWRRLLDDTLPLEERLKMVRSIDHRTTQADRAFLLDLLGRSPRTEVEQDWWVVMNEIMEQFRVQGIGSEDYAARLAALIRDRSQHDMVRDYAIQHLAQWIAPAGGGGITPGEEDSEHLRAAIAAISSAVAEPSLPDSTVSGTALMALFDASSRLPDETTSTAWESLRPYLAEVIRGETHAATHFRVAAIQTAALRGDRNHLPSIRKLATDESTDATLRLSSLAALGLYSDPADRPYLESIATGSSKYRYAAQAALNKQP